MFRSGTVIAAAGGQDPERANIELPRRLLKKFVISLLNGFQTIPKSFAVEASGSTEMASQ